VELPAADAADGGDERLVPAPDHASDTHMVVAGRQVVGMRRRPHAVVGEGRIAHLGQDVRQPGAGRAADEEHGVSCTVGRA
jgi:hypothetical protein